MNITLGDAISGVTVYVWRYAHTNAWGAIVDVPGLRVLDTTSMESIRGTDLRDVLDAVGRHIESIDLTEASRTAITSLLRDEALTPELELF